MNIEEYITQLENLIRTASIDEVDTKLGINNKEDLLHLGEIWVNHVQPLFNFIETDASIDRVVRLAFDLIKSLEDKGILKDTQKKGIRASYSTKDYVTFMQTMNKLPSWKDIVIMEPIEACKKLNAFYKHAYEKVLGFKLKKIAEMISGKKLRKKGIILDELNKYDCGKFTPIFMPIIPQIRNSIAHEDWQWVPDKKVIVFFDENKDPLEMTLLKYFNLCINVMKLDLIFSYIDYKLMEPFLLEIIRKLEIVHDYLKNNQLELKKTDDKSLTLWEYSELIEKGTRK